MAELREVEAGIRALVFGRELEPSRLAGVDEEKQRVYRELVRGSVSSVIASALPVLRACWGAAETDALIARFLDEVGPSTRFYRAIPMDFAAWAQGPLELPHAAIRELIHFEVTQLEVTQAPDPAPDPARRARPDDELAVEFCPSARLLAYAHPVHTLTTKSGALPDPSRAPVFLIAHRVGEKMHWLRLQAPVAQLLALAAGLPLGRAFAALRAAGPVDEAFVRSWLVNLRARGAILGFYPPEEE